MVKKGNSDSSCRIYPHLHPDKIKNEQETKVEVGNNLVLPWIPILKNYQLAQWQNMETTCNSILHNYQIDPQPQAMSMEVTTDQELHNLENESSPKEKVPDLIAGKRLI
tara:strand:- start:1110 stop:1436 length:327 start_codon:yes stop_codon:yes gene_type:complete